MKHLILLAAIALSLPAYATDKHRHEKPAPVIVHRHEHAAVGALVGAGITYWLMRRHARRHPKHAVCSAEREDRAYSTCVSK